MIALFFSAHDTLPSFSVYTSDVLSNPVKLCCVLCVHCRHADNGLYTPSHSRFFHQSCSC